MIQIRDGAVESSMNGRIQSSSPDADGALMLAQPSGRPDFGRLIEAVAQHRDRQAFAELFAYFAPRLKSYLIRTGAAAGTAEDFAQEAMMTVWRKAALFDRERAGASTWVFTIARNLRIDAARRDGKALRELDLSELPNDPAQPDQILSGIDDEARIRAALEALSADQARVVRLSFFHDKAHAEIAQELGLPLGTVKSRLRLAMIKLRDLLSER
ncbi:RNA polymerase sigma-70 factor (ECF subfamily) [Kaistia dalseonensis]|uniref:RNA polymerase sigma-70 factor (ECF subfamily) n=2 Tax=Kaistia dalseonensis TaxID=410840 RepID=A0ABU0H7L1_9HYPH|nr:sigma-70 family RNA polymerase sigma factor [Kaistia dalseonensis]MDQ0438288.1 RNA polymerase sigma-70 factor (ECF subfamily) [Kaistia dalseonensis]